LWGHNGHNECWFPCPGLPPFYCGAAREGAHCHTRQAPPIRARIGSISRSGDPEITFLTLTCQCSLSPLQTHSDGRCRSPDPPIHVLVTIGSGPSAAGSFRSGRHLRLLLHQLGGHVRRRSAWQRVQPVPKPVPPPNSLVTLSTIAVTSANPVRASASTLVGANLASP
jgi:hypothetical protein